MLQPSKRKVLCPVVQQGPAAVKPLGANFALDPAVVVLREVRGERPLSREGEQANAASEQALALVVKSHVQFEQPHIGEHLGAAVALVRTVRWVGVEVHIKELLRGERFRAEMAAVGMGAGHPHCFHSTGSHQDHHGNLAALSSSGIRLSGVQCLHASAVLT